MLEFKNVSGLSKQFKLENISFLAPKGFISGITGTNGAGKTTLFHYIIDDKQSYDGEILYNGMNIRDNFSSFKNRMAFISDEKRFFQHMSIADNVKLLSIFFDSWDDAIFKKQLQKQNISLGRQLSSLSRGKYINFQIAFAMAHEATLYLLDEATAGMDPVFRKDFFNLLHELIATEDVTILMTTHIEEEIEVHMDYRGVLEQGKLVSFEEVEVR